LAAGIMSEGILIIASVVIATSIAGVVMSQVGIFESTFTATTENQKDIMLTKVKIVYATNTTNTNVNVWVKNIGINNGRVNQVLEGFIR
jgi:flagellar protein FlaG